VKRNPRRISLGELENKAKDIRWLALLEIEDTIVYINTEI
jgi:hypothetical protein